GVRIIDKLLVRKSLLEHTQDSQTARTAIKYPNWFARRFHSCVHKNCTRCWMLVSISHAMVFMYGTTSSSGNPSPHNTTWLPIVASGQLRRSTVSISIETRPITVQRLLLTKMGVPSCAVA